MVVGNGNTGESCGIVLGNGVVHPYVEPGGSISPVSDWVKFAGVYKRVGGMVWVNVGGPIRLWEANPGTYHFAIRIFSMDCGQKTRGRAEDFSSEDFVGG